MLGLKLGDIDGLKLGERLGDRDGLTKDCAVQDIPKRYPVTGTPVAAPLAASVKVISIG